MTRLNLQLRMDHSAILRYGLAATSFALALGVAVITQQYNFRNVEVALLLFAVAYTAWYAGPGPAALACAASLNASCCTRLDAFFASQVTRASRGPLTARRTAAVLR